MSKCSQYDLLTLSQYNIKKKPIYVLISVSLPSRIKYNMRTDVTHLSMRSNSTTAPVRRSDRETVHTVHHYRPFPRIAGCNLGPRPHKCPVPRKLASTTWRRWANMVHCPTALWCHERVVDGFLAASLNATMPPCQ